MLIEVDGSISDVVYSVAGGNVLACALNTIDRDRPALTVQPMMGEITLWSIDSGRPRLMWHKKDRACGILSLSVSANLVAASYVDGTILMLSRVNGEAYYRNTIDAGIKCNDIVFSSDGKWLVGAGDDGTLTVWDVKKRQIHRSMKVSHSPLISLALSPRDDVVAVGTEDGAVKVLPLLKEGKQLLLTKQKSAVLCLAFGDSGALLIGTDNGSIQLWKVGAKIKVFDRRIPGAGSVETVSFGSDGMSLIAGYNVRESSGSDAIARWESSSTKPARTVTGVGTYFCVIPTKKLIVSGGADGQLWLWRE